jgi:beta-glucanase (GH16 family)
MKKAYLLFVISFLLSCGKSTSGEWNLIWSDEFTTDGKPDPTKWTFTSRGTSDWNRYCVADTTTAVVKSGKLYLKGRLTGSETEKYKTGGVQSKGNFSFKYGKIEVCALLGKGKGSWPAIWMMPEKSVYGGWPKSGEIDIMEQLNFDAIFYQTVHSDYVDIQKQKDNPKYYITTSFKPGEYNVFGLEWHPDRLDFTINGSKTFSYPRVEGKGTSQWPFDQEFYLILNQALGGNWVGTINDNDLPLQMVVDWVRVYQMSDM